MVDDVKIMSHGVTESLSLTESLSEMKRWIRESRESGRIVVRVLDSHSCDRGSNPGQGKSQVPYVLKNIPFV